MFFWSGAQSFDFKMRKYFREMGRRNVLIKVIKQSRFNNIAGDLSLKDMHNINVSANEVPTTT